MHIAMNQLHLSHFNDAIVRVLTETDEHVGNLKLINGRWKFKRRVAVNDIPHSDPLETK